MAASQRRVPNGYVEKGGYDSYVPDDSFQPSPTHFEAGPKAFSVRVHVNNDDKEPGKRVLVQKHIRDLDNFLDICGKKTKPPFGCPRRLYTPRGGRQIKYIDDLTADGIYVITGNESFKKHNYRDIQDKRLSPRQKGYGKISMRPVQPVVHPADKRLRDKSARCQQLGHAVRGLRLRVHVIGKNEVPYKMVSIPHREKDDIIKVTDHIANQLCLNPIMKLYEINSEGGPVSNFKEIWKRSPLLRLDSNQDNTHVPLERDMHILAVPNGEHNRKLDFCIYHLDGKPNFRTSPRTGALHLFDSFSGPNTPYKHNRKLNKYSKVPGIQSNTMSPASNMSGSNAGGRSHQRQRNQRPAQQVDYDRDDGVFRAKNGGLHSKDARQVNETKETRTERHIDDREAEVVNEEDIRHEKTTPIPPGTELNKQPSKEQKQNADSGMQTKNKEVKKGKNERDAQKVSVKNERDAQKVSVKDEAKTDSKDKSDDKVKDEASDKPQEKVKDDGKSDRNVVQTPSQLNQQNVEPNKPPMSTTPPKSIAATPDIKQNQEHVNGDRDRHHQRIDEYDDDLYGNHNGRNQSRSNQPDSRASGPNDNYARNDSPPRPNDNYERNQPSPKQPEPRAFTPPSRGAANRKQKEDEAAAKIQAGFRGHKTRKQYSERKNQMRQARDEVRPVQTPPQTLRRDNDDEAKRKEQAASVIQASYKGHRTRKAMANSKQVREQEKLDRQNKAASKIQGGYHGYKVRQQYASKRKNNVEVVKDLNDNEKKDENNDREMKDKAAAKIQSNFKGYMTRKTFKAQKAKKEIDNKQSVDNKSYAEQEKAASKIQAGFRGHQVRKSYGSKKANKNNLQEQPEETDVKKQNEAASRIQANYKGYRERKSYLDKKKEKAEKEQAASRIQASFTGYKTRKEISEKKKAQLPDESNQSQGKPRDLDKAAATIQSGYRGYRVRKQYNAKVILDSDPESDVDQLPDSALTRQHVNKTQITLAKKHNQIATIIQICYRADHFRKMFVDDDKTEYKTDQYVDVNAKVQAAFQGFVARKLEEDALTKPIEILPSQESAATTIQAHYRGYKVRKTKLYPLRQVNIIQAAFRAHITRKLNNIQTVEIDSIEGADYYASLIQGLCRGYMTRQSIGRTSRQVKSGHSVQGPTKPNDEVSFWEDSNVKMYSDRTIRQAATKIQCAYHALIVRNSYVIVRETIKDRKIKAAVSIQSWFRGCQVRKGCKNNMSEINMKENDSENGTEMSENRKNYAINKSEDPNTEIRSVQFNENENTSIEAISRPSTGRKRTKSGKKSRGQTPDVILANSGMFENESVISGPSSGKSKQSQEYQRVLRERSGGRVRSGVKRDHSGKSKKKHDKYSDNEIKVDKAYNFDDLERENSNDSFETDKTYKTIKSKMSGKSYGREIEKEGESPREIEDVASELSKMRRNAMAVCQIQAAFRAYKLRREVSELLSGGGELMDIKSVDRAVSALKKDFKLRSAKVRRLGSYQFKRKPKASDWWDAESEDDMVKELTANTVQAAFRSFQGRKALHKSVRSHSTQRENEQPEKCIDVEKEENKENLIENNTASNACSKIEAAYRGYRARITEKSIKENKALKTRSKIEAAYRGYRARKTEKGIREKYSVEMCIPENNNADQNKHFEKQSEANKIIQAGYKGFVTRRARTCANEKESNMEQYLKENRLENENILQEASTKIEAAFRGYRTRETEKKLRKNLTPISHKKSLTLEEKCISDRRIQAAFKGFMARLQQNQRQKIRKQSTSKIKAAYQGYHKRKQCIKTNTVNYESRSIKSASSKTSFHVEMHSQAISNRATVLQAAFSAYQTRKVFISLTRLVEQGSSADSTSFNLERMGSLSETDDFKLRHKSIVKIQALEAERRQMSNKTPKTKGSSSRELRSGNVCAVNQIKLPLIPTNSLLSGKRPKSGFCQENTKFQTMDIKSKTQPELKRCLTNEKLHGIEIYVKKKMAATVIQSHAKGFFVRQKYRGKSRKRGKKPKSVTSASRGSSRSKDENNKPDWVKSEIRARTASIKLEAEKRKLIAQQIKQKKYSKEVSDSTTHIENNGVKNHIILNEVEKNDSNQKQSSNKQLTPIMSERLITDQSRQLSALKIQKVYRGYAVRKNLKSQLKNTAELEGEYEEWKKKRLQAAVAIQSIWRGYMVRRELQKEQEEQANMIQDPFWKCESPPEMLVINIGRTKSEIERANQRYERCSMIQMVVRASKVRRNMQVKMAKRRGKKINSANIIHAVLAGYMERKERKCLKCAANIQSLAKGFLVREQLQERIRMRKVAQQNGATRLQAAYKACRKRKDNEAQKEAQRKLAEAHQSAKLIQAAIRGFRIREDLEETKLIMQKEAAIKIQASIAGHKERIRKKERKLAATKLTAAYKSYKRRNDLRLYKEKMEMKRQAATRLQSAFKAYKRRVARRLYNEKMQNERVAATRLQSVYRSYRTRCEMREKKALIARHNKAISVIQSTARGRLERVRYKLLKQLQHDRETATLKIQSMYRGYKERLSVKKLKRMVEVNTAAKDIVDLLIDNAFGYIQQRQESAERIQSTVKAFKIRSQQTIEREMLSKQRHVCASKIQAVVRAEQGRLWNEKMKEMAIQNTAATKIQSMYRGHYTRKQIEKEKSMIAEIEPPFMSARTRSGRLLALSLDEVLMKNARAMILFHKKAGELQAAFRAYKMRQNIQDRLCIKQSFIDMTPRREKSINLTSPEDSAAVLIQKTWRGYSDRKAYERRITVKRKVWYTSASIIHAAVHGYGRRKSAKRRKDRMRHEGSELIRRKRREAADIIACAFRALQKRNEKVALRAEM